MLYKSIILVLSFSAGGMDLYAQKGKIKVTNTLESRLDLMSGQVTQPFLAVRLNYVYHFISDAS